jgi:hypothetical protein
VESIGFSPGGEFRHDIELAQQLPHHFAGIITLAELLELREDSRKTVLGFRDGAFRVVLALAFQALVMSLNFLSVEIRAATAQGTVHNPRPVGGFNDRKMTFRGHLGLGG